MYNLNEWHHVLRDTTAPTLELENGLRPKLFFGTETFIYNMIALDSGKDIRRNIQVITEGMLQSHIEGTTNLTFSVLDSGGNEATLNTDVDIVGSWVQNEAIVHDFQSLTELPSNLTPENGTTYEITETGLQFTGSRPPSPYWNLVHQMNANGAAQFTVRGEGAGMTFRWRDSANFNWAVILGGTIEIRERVNGAWLSRGALAIEDYDPNTDYMLGLEAVDDIVKVYVDGDKLGDIKVYDNLYATGWGLWSNSGNVTISKAMFAKPGDISFGDYELVNTPPIANAGLDQSVPAGAIVYLDGSASSDLEDGDVTQYGWEQVEGPPATIFLANSARPYFEAPSSLTPQELRFKLTTLDSQGLNATDTVDIFVASIEESQILSIMETLDFELITQGDVTAYAGRANREVMRLKPSSTAGIITEDGFLDLTKNNIDKIEIIANGETISNENSDSIKVDGTRLLPRLGDLPIDTGDRTSSSLSFTIVLYVGGDTRGLVVAASGTKGFKQLAFNKSAA